MRVFLREMKDILCKIDWRIEWYHGMVEVGDKVCLHCRCAPLFLYVHQQSSWPVTSPSLSTELQEHVQEEFSVRLPHALSGL